MWPPRAPRNSVGRSGAMRGPSEAISRSALQETVLVLLAELAQPGGADLFAHLDQ